MALPGRHCRTRSTPRAAPDVAALQVALRGVGLYQQTIDGVGRAGHACRGAPLPGDARAWPSTGSRAPRPGPRSGGAGGPSYGSRTIRRGDSGWDVAALQFRLAWHGFPSGSVDGGFGSHVEAAVRRFQAYSGVAADGTAGPQTLRLLRGAIPRSPIWLKHPVRAGIGDRFGPRGNRFHTGLDYPASTGTLVTAAGRGHVVFAGWDTGGYGNTVVIEHPLGVRSLYAHLSRIGVNKGTRWRRATRRPRRHDRRLHRPPPALRAAPARRRDRPADRAAPLAAESPGRTTPVSAR